MRNLGLVRHFLRAPTCFFRPLHNFDIRVLSIFLLVPLEKININIASYCSYYTARAQHQPRFCSDFEGNGLLSAFAGTTFISDAEKQWRGFSMLFVRFSRTAMRDRGHPAVGFGCESGILRSRDQGPGHPPPTKRFALLKECGTRPALLLAHGHPPPRVTQQAKLVAGVRGALPDRLYAGVGIAAGVGDNPDSSDSAGYE